MKHSFSIVFDILHETCWLCTKLLTYGLLSDTLKSRQKPLSMTATFSFLFPFGTDQLSRIRFKCCCHIVKILDVPLPSFEKSRCYKCKTFKGTL